jgi:hypothetical protein
MKIRVGIDISIDEAVLKDSAKEAQLVRIGAAPQGEIEIDFWIPLLSPGLCKISGSTCKAFAWCRPPGRAWGLS